jgi:hypothetical protein
MRHREQPESGRRQIEEGTQTPRCRLRKTRAKPNSRRFDGTQQGTQRDGENPERHPCHSSKAHQRPPLPGGDGGYRRDENQPTR